MKKRIAMPVNNLTTNDIAPLDHAAELEPAQFQAILRGRDKTAASAARMPGIRNFIEKYRDTDIFKGKNILGCFTPTAETAVFVLALRELGVTGLRWCSDNATHTDPDIVAYLDYLKIPIFAKPNMTRAEFEETFDQVIQFTPEQKKAGILLIDDGCDVTRHIAEHHPDFFQHVTMIQENTTCGIGFLKNLYRENQVPVPSININDCYTKSYFDNRYGVSGSFVDAYKQITGEEMTGKTGVVFGYGPVGQGMANQFRKNGANPIVVESDILRLLQAKYDKYTVMDKKSALAMGNIMVTATGCCDVVSAKDFEDMKDGAKLCNIGQNTNEYDYAYLKAHLPHRRIAPNIDEFTLPSGKTIKTICEGGLVNFFDGKATPPEEMSLTFTMHLLAMVANARHPEQFAGNKIHPMPQQYEIENTELNFPDLEAVRTKLTPQQKVYLGHPVHK